jgi:hypothetical protein
LRVGYPKVRYFDSNAEYNYIGYATYGNAVYTPSGFSLSSVFTNFFEVTALLRRKALSNLRNSVLTHHLAVAAADQGYDAHE